MILRFPVWLLNRNAEVSNDRFPWNTTIITTGSLLPLSTLSSYDDSKKYPHRTLNWNLEGMADMLSSGFAERTQEYVDEITHTVSKMRGVY